MEPPARKRPRGFETAGDMVRTMAVVLALVLGVFFLGARPQGDQRPPADVAGRVSEARAGGLQISEPVLPQGWRASNSRFGPDASEGLPTFHVGYLDPAGQYGGISAAVGVTPTWVEGVAGDSAVDSGSRDLAGRTWEVWEDAETGSTTLVAEAGADDGTSDVAAPTVAVTSRGTDAALQALAQAAVTAVDGS